MNKMLAVRVKELRCGPICHSWRRIAEIISEEYPNLDGLVWVDEDKQINGIQMAGQELCQQSAVFFGEDPNSEPWD
jgi:hypothetical protein